ncbi:MAG: hypothetical protein IJR88_01765 [Clostridia bacterium]|nr:hypothetical protein [Clostridia bacterium]
MKNCYIGFDTSNYTTSIAVCEDDGKVIANLKSLLPVADGERGLRQSDALFAHVKNLPGMIRELEPLFQNYRVVGVGCSTRPRDAADSYMPCFLAGKNAAYAFAAGAGVPVKEFSHQSGHLMAALYSSGQSELLFKAPFAAFHVSGGTTEVLYVEPKEDGFTVKIVGGTADLNAGQAIDRVGVLMGFSFPAGRRMEELSKTETDPLPPIRVSVKDGVCNLSGLENKAAELWEKTKDPAYVSRFVFAFVGKTLAKLTEYVDSLDPGIPILYAGGVMSNQFLQETLGKRKNTYFATPEFSSDNAAGIALLTRKSLLNR